MEKLDFYPECGTKLFNADDFCANCGLQISDQVVKETITKQPSMQPRAAAVENDVNIPVTKSKTVSTPASVRAQIRSAKNTFKIVFAVIAVLVLILSSAYFGGKYVYGKDRQLQTLQDEALSGNISKMSNALVDDNGQQLNDQNIIALKNLFMQSSSSLNMIRRELKIDDDKQAFHLKKVGMYYGLFPKYKIAESAKDVVISTNVKDPEFTVDGQKYIGKFSNDAYHFNTFTPGVYRLNVRTKDLTNDTPGKLVIGVESASGPVQQSINEKKKHSSKSKISTSDDIEDKPVVTSTKRSSQDRSNHFSDTNVRRSSSNDHELTGRYYGNPDLTLNSDGTYSLGSKTGTYSINDLMNGKIQITYHQNGAGTITEEYYYSDGELHSDKYDQSWYK